MKKIREIIRKIKNFFKGVKPMLYWYGTIVVMLLVAIEIFDPWLCFAYIFLGFCLWGFNKVK